MIFIFYIMISTSLYYVLDIKCLSVHSKTEFLNENEIISNFNDSEGVTESGSVMSKHKSLFYIIGNPSEAPNLKSNIFDKMLSNEMLSIKQHRYEKSETNVSPIYITFKNSIATPTLELKQRWPIDKSITQTETKTEEQNVNIQSQLDTYKDNNKFNNSIKSKVIGVRSFSAKPVKQFGTSNNNYNSKHQCSCMKNNQHTTCSLRCSEHRKKTCTQIENFVTESPQCTRNVIPFSYYPYYVYSTLFLGVTKDSSVIYYHPDVINELKLPKHKYPQIRTTSFDKSYFEESDNKYENEYLENESNSDDDQEEETSFTKDKYEKGKTDRPDKDKTIYFIDYKESNSVSDADKFSNGYLHVVDRDKFIEDVVEDLKVYYSDAVIKDCYCSVSSFKFRTENFVIYIAMFIIFLMYCIFDITCY